MGACKLGRKPGDPADHRDIFAAGLIPRVWADRDQGTGKDGEIDHAGLYPGGKYLLFGQILSNLPALDPADRLGAGGGDPAGDPFYYQKSCITDKVLRQAGGDLWGGGIGKRPQPISQTGQSIGLGAH